MCIVVLHGTISTEEEEEEEEKEGEEEKEKREFKSNIYHRCVSSEQKKC
jgi:hypothetical protein